jgi:opacity protein-like surface antigen
VRNFLRVAVGVVALCIVSWAQAPASAAPPQPTTPAPAAQTPSPAPAPDKTDQDQPEKGSSTPESPSAPAPNSANLPPKFARLELFAGYSFAQAGFFNAGHWAQLNGWNASFGLNAASWIGLVVEGSQFFGTSKIPTSSPAPFPSCGSSCPPGPLFNVDTRQYNILFGLQFPYRKYERWTPFGELMFGHSGVSGTAVLVGPEKEVSSGLGLLAGGGADYKINQRFAVRIKADYLQTRTDFPLIGKAKQDNLRLSVGIVIRNVHKKKRTLEEETPPE